MDTSTNEENLRVSLEQGAYGSYDIFQLNIQSFSNCNYLVIQNIKPEGNFKLVCSGLSDDSNSIDLLEAFNSGLLEIFEQPNEEVLQIVSNKPPKTGGAITSSHAERRMLLETDSTRDEWKSILQPGNTYALQFSKDKGELWAYYDDESCTRAPEDIAFSERIPVGREGVTIQFTVYNDPAPPKLFLDVHLYNNIGNRPGRPRGFLLTFDVSSDAKEPFTVDKSGTPFSSWPFDFHSLSQLVRFTDAETGEDVNWPSVEDCDLEAFPWSLPPSSEFEEIQSWRPFRHVHRMDEDGESGVGGLLDLEADKQYIVRVPETITWRFERWMWGTKEDVLMGNEAEQKYRWDRAFEGGRGTGLKVYPRAREESLTVYEQMWSADEGGYRQEKGFRVTQIAK